MNSLLLIGAPGAGKTLVAREIGERGWTAGDTGQALAAHFEMDEFFVPIEIASHERLKVERHILSGMLDDVEADPQSRFVIAVGSDVLAEQESTDGELTERIQGLRKSGAIKVVQLTATLSEFVKRNGLMGQRSAGLVMPRKNFRELLERRRPVYDEVSDVVVDTTEHTPADIVDYIERELGA